MRKLQQEKIFEMLQTLDEVVSEIKRLTSAGNTAVVINLLSDACEFIGHIKGYINEIKGEDTQTVALLNELADMLSTKRNDINNSLRIELGFSKTIGKKLIRIQNSVRSELEPNKIEVAFFPYMASMSDSLESIYIAAKNDLDCDAYWIPVPYYERKSDGSLGQMHYDGSKYHTDLQTVDWQKYDLEVRRPDIIFAHAPYDENNYVTYVHPNYHFKRLQDFTNMLIYIPYFVVIDDVPEQFCVLPGTVYADKVVVQSEKVKQTYIREFSKWVKENGITKNHPLWKKAARLSEKFVALGSPKFDAVINAKRENFTLPEEWRNLIEGTDGHNKKVIFYNIGFTSLQYGIEIKLEKLKSVLKFFKNRDDFVLWWRPHPLNKESVLSMRPQHFAEYEKLVDCYKREGWGIYDDTSDLHRAIAYSDAYYGDGSSLIPLYQCTGKPVMLQNMTKTGFFLLRYENLFDDGEFFYFTSININGLFKMDKISWEAEYLGSFPGEGSNGRLYSNINKYKGKLYFTPGTADAIAVYDLESGEFSRIEIEKHSTKLSSLKFLFAYSFKNWLFMLPFYYPAVVRYNYETGEVDYFCKCEKELNEAKTDEGFRLIKNAVADNASLVMFCGENNSIIEFNLEMCEMKVLDRLIETEQCVVGGICFDGSEYWINLANLTKICKWNRLTLEKKIFSVATGDIKYRVAYNHITFADGYVWLLPGHSDSSLKVDVKTGKIAKVNILSPDNIQNDEDQWKFLFFKNFNEKFYSFDMTSDKLVEYDYNSGAIRKSIITVNPITSIELVDLVKESFRSEQTAYLKTSEKHIIFEPAFFTLNDTLDMLIQASNAMPAPPRKELLNYTNTIGEAIFRWSKETVMRD